MNTLPAADGKGILGVVAATMGEATDLGSIKKPNKADSPVTLGWKTTIKIMVFSPMTG